MNGMSTADAGPTDVPRAPSQAAWDALSADARRRVVESLSSSLSDAELGPPESTDHSDAKISARDGLRRFFGGIGRRAFVPLGLVVYYPDEPRFAPDLLVVFDVPTHARTKWVVSAEGRGLDFVLEVLVAGDRQKDLTRNVERYSRLGIPEYFVYDRGTQRLHGWRREGRTYRPILPQLGRWPSGVLGLELALEEGRLRFYRANAALLESDEIIEKLGHAFDELQRSADERYAELEARAADATRRAEEADRAAQEEARRAEEEARRAEEEARRAEEAEARVRALTVELEKLRRKE